MRCRVAGHGKIAPAFAGHGEICVARDGYHGGNHAGMRRPSIVMPGLVPGIHVFAHCKT